MKKVLLRTSGSMHRQVAIRAKLDGVSMNAWIAEALAMAVGAREAADRIVVMPTASNPPDSWLKLEVS